MTNSLKVCYCSPDLRLPWEKNSMYFMHTDINDLFRNIEGSDTYQKSKIHDTTYFRLFSGLYFHS